MESNSILDKEKRISAEEQKLTKLFKNIGKSKKSIARSLIQRAAYMRVTLEDYEKDILLNGYVEPFTQSANTKPYDRERPVARLHNNTNKIYLSVISKLVGMLPDHEESEEDSAFMKFINSRDN